MLFHLISLLHSGSISLRLLDHCEIGNRNVAFEESLYGSVFCCKLLFFIFDFLQFPLLTLYVTTKSCKANDYNWENTPSERKKDPNII